MTLSVCDFSTARTVACYGVEATPPATGAFTELPAYLDGGFVSGVGVAFGIGLLLAFAGLMLRSSEA